MGGRQQVIVGVGAVLSVAAGALVWMGVPAPVYLDRGERSAASHREREADDSSVLTSVPVSRPTDTGVDPQDQTDDRTRLVADDNSFVVPVRAFRGRDQRLAGARLRIAIYPGFEAAGEATTSTVLTTNRDGEATWRLPVPTETITVEVGSGDADVVGRKVSRVVMVGEAARRLDVHLYPLDHVVRGVVTGADGEPVARARVAWWQLLPPVHTDSRGRFHLRVASAYSRLRYFVVAPGYSRFTETLYLEGPGTTDVQVQLQPGFRVFGTVTDTEGRPLEGVQVSTFWARVTGERTFTDAEGNYQVDTLVPGRNTHYVVATFEGYVRTRGRTTAPGREARIDLTMKRAALVTGTVFGPEGRPLAGARVGISEGGRARGRGTVVTGEDGRFQLQHRPQVRSHLWTYRYGLAVDRRSIGSIPEGGAVDLQVHLQKGHFVSGRVLDTEGQGIVGAQVSVRLDRRLRLGIEGTTDTAGCYRVTDLPKGKLLLFVSAPGHLPNRQDPVLDSEGFDIVLERSVVLRGRVVDGVSGAPIQDFRIRVLKRSKSGIGMPWLGQGKRFHDTEGRWETGREAIVAGTTFDLEAVAEGYAPTVLKNITATRDMAPDTVLLRMFRGSTLPGQVLDRATGRPVAGAKITLLQPGRTRMPPAFRGDTSTRSGDDGTFLFEHVAAGDFLLKVERDQKPAFLHGPLTVPAAARMDRVIIQLPGASWIQGVVQDPGGRELPNVLVTLTPGRIARSQIWLGRKTCRTDAVGAFRFDGLVNTDYVLNASSETPDGVTLVFRAEVNAKSEGATQVVLAPAGGCSVTGTVRFLGKAGTGIRLQLYRRPDSDGGNGQWQTFGAGVKGEGFTVRGLPAGTYNFVTVYHLDGRRRSHSGPRNVAVRPGSENQIAIQIPPR